MKRFLRLVGISSVLGVLLLALITIQLPSEAVAPTQSEPIVIPSLPPESQTSPMFSYQPIPIELYNDPASYRIAYLSAEGAIPTESGLSPHSSLGQITQANIAHSMDDIYRLEAEAPIEALIIHTSAYSLADREWIASAARRGVVLATINLSRLELAELQSGYCTKQQAQSFVGKYENRSGNFSTWSQISFRVRTRQTLRLLKQVVNLGNSSYLGQCLFPIAAHKVI